MEHGQTAKMLPPQSMTLQSQLSQVFLQRHIPGKNITQSVKVKYNGKTLKSGTDYTVSYSNNKKVGTATVRTGKGQYGGTVSKTFKIKPCQCRRYRSSQRSQRLSLLIGRRKALQQVMRCSTPQTLSLQAQRSLMLQTTRPTK